MAIRAEDLTWQQGQEGEDRFAGALDSSGLFNIDMGFQYVRNLEFRMRQDDLEAIGAPLTLDQYEATFDIGDIDFLVIGPTGVFVFDVKNWRGGSLAHYKKAAQGLKLQVDFVSIRLAEALDDMGLEVQGALVAVGAQPEFDYVDDVPVATPDEAVDILRQSPVVVDRKRAFMLMGFAAIKFDKAELPV